MAENFWLGGSQHDDLLIGDSFPGDPLESNPTGNLGE